MIASVTERLLRQHFYDSIRSGILYAPIPLFKNSARKTSREAADLFRRAETPLKSFLQLHVPEPAFEGGKRFVVVVFEGAGHERRIRIKDVLHSDRERRAIEPGTPSARI